jgi:tetratricopeptide (TPR) repeat protein
MRPPLRRNSSLLVPARIVCGLVFPVFGIVDAQAADLQVPLPQILGEANMQIKARKLADAAQLLDMVMDRLDKGEALPPGVTLDAIQALAANTHFQLKSFSRAEALASKLLARTSTGAVSSDTRLILGLSLALQNQFAEAVPVFAALEETVTHRNKARQYRAMAAQQANQPAVAIDALSRILSEAPRDAEWAQSALTLISLHLQSKNFAAASRGLDLLRSNLQVVDNLAALNTLSLQLGDVLLAANDPAGALAAYRTVLPRKELLKVQQLRTARMEGQIARLKQLNRNTIDDVETAQRLESRIKATKAALDEIGQRGDYDATLFYRLGHTFLIRGGPWEAALVFQRLLKEFPEAAERELAYAELVRAYADTGRIEKMRLALDEFMRMAPASKQLPQTLYVAAQAAADAGRKDMQLAFLSVGVKQFGDSELAEPMMLMVTNAHFSGGRFEEARATAEEYLKKYSAGRFAEDATYLHAMASLVLGEAEAALKEIRGYLDRFPEGRFVADGRYRIAAAHYSLQQFSEAEAQLASWLRDYPVEHPQRGEALSTQGDVFAGLERIDDAIKSYREAMGTRLSDDQLGYVLDELTKHYQGKRDFATAALLWEDFARENPDHPFVINAAYWIGKLRSREGKHDEAVSQMGEIARRYVEDPARDAVERLLTQMAAILARNPKAGPDGVKPAPLSADAIAARVLKELVTPQNRSNPTVLARVLFTRAEVASLRKNPALRDQLIGQIGAGTAAEALSPGLLGVVGDQLLAQGQRERAKACYDQLVLSYPKSMYADFGYIGLAELAYQAGDYDTAMLQFTNAIDRAGARFKLREATLGQAKTLLAQGKLDQAKELFEQIAANKAWRGPATAQSIYALGEILLKRAGPGDLAQAQAHFQRVFISYKKFTPWVAKAYLTSGQTFEKLDKPREALATYREMKRDARLVDFPEYQTGLERISILEEWEKKNPEPAPNAAPVANKQGGAS